MRGIFPLLLILFFIVSGCSKKSGSKEENTTMLPAEHNDSNQTAQSFLLLDIDERELNITMEDEQMVFQNIDQPLVLINLFATWCPPCRGELPDLSQLQRKHSRELFVVGVLVNDEQNSTQLRQFMKKYGANYFISHAEANSELVDRLIKRLKISDNFPIPLSILYKNGKLYRYYEGAMPIEMIENELKKALNKD